MVHYIRYAEINYKSQTTTVSVLIHSAKKFEFFKQFCFTLQNLVNYKNAVCII